MDQPDLEWPAPDVDLVEVVVVVVPGEAAARAVLASVEELERQCLVSVLDNALVAHVAEGTCDVPEPRSATRDLTASPRRRLLTDNDLRLVGTAVPPDSLAVVLLVEDTWAQPLAGAARRVGGRVAGGERIPADRLHSVLQASWRT